MIEPAFFVLGTIALGILAVAAVAVGVIAVRHQSRKREQASAAWKEVARRMGLAHRPGRFFRPEALLGTIAGIEIEVDYVGRGTPQAPILHSRVRAKPAAASAGSIPKDLALETEGFFASIAKALGGADVRTGDAAFDAAVRVRGSEETALAALTPDARRIAARSLGQMVPVVSDGGVSIEVKGFVEDPARLIALVDDARRLATELALAPGEARERLAWRVRSDPDAGARRRALEALLALQPAWAETQATARHALVDEDAAVRLEAGRSLAAEGLPVLEVLAGDAAVPAEVRAESLRILGAAGDRDRCLRVARRILAMEAPPPVLSFVAQLIGAQKLAELAEALRRLAGRAEPEVAAAAARALGEIGDRSSEAALLALLARKEPEPRVAAASALAHVGTAAAVEPLRASARGFVVDAELLQTTRSAVQAIQARLGNPDAGRLSVSEPPKDAGGLALAADVEGFLSTPIEPPKEREDEGRADGDLDRSRTR